MASGLFHDIKRRVREDVAPLRPWGVSLVGGYLGYAPTPDAYLGANRRRHGGARRVAASDPFDDWRT